MGALHQITFHYLNQSDHIIEGNYNVPAEPPVSPEPGAHQQQQQQQPPQPTKKATLEDLPVPGAQQQPQPTKKAMLQDLHKSYSLPVQHQIQNPFYSNVAPEAPPVKVTDLSCVGQK